MQDVKTFPRAVALPKAACLGVVAALVLTACGTGGEGGEPTTTSSAVAAASDNPWDLPLEQRPPLFDPCTEIPADALTESGFSEADRQFESTVNNPGELVSCTWINEEVLFSVVSSWKSREERLASDPKSLRGEFRLAGKPGERLVDRSDRAHKTARAVFLTQRGSTVMSITIVDTLNRYNGEITTDPYEVLDEVATPIAKLLPKEL